MGRVSAVISQVGEFCVVLLGSVRRLLDLDDIERVYAKRRLVEVHDDETYLMISMSASSSNFAKEAAFCPEAADLTSSRILSASCLRCSGLAWSSAAAFTDFDERRT